MKVIKLHHAVIPPYCQTGTTEHCQKGAPLLLPEYSVVGQSVYAEEISLLGSNSIIPNINSLQQEAFKLFSERFPTEAREAQKSFWCMRDFNCLSMDFKNFKLIYDEIVNKYNARQGKFIATKIYSTAETFCVYENIDEVKDLLENIQFLTT